MNFSTFDSREAASAAAAARIAAELRATLDRVGTAYTALSGGTSPLRCYQQLASARLSWRDVRITLTDERCVPGDHPDSNERMLREHLLSGGAHQASFVPMNDLTFAEPFSVVLVGMGDDGHFASIFPDASELGLAVDTTRPPAVVRTSTAASPYRRETLNLSALTYTNALLLLAFGDSKRRHLLQPDKLPIDALLRQARVPVDVFWAA